jgi:hypothetical protein
MLFGDAFFKYVVDLGALMRSKAALDVWLGVFGGGRMVFILQIERIRAYDIRSCHGVVVLHAASGPAARQSAALSRVSPPPCMRSMRLCGALVVQYVCVVVVQECMVEWGQNECRARCQSAQRPFVWWCQKSRVAEMIAQVGAARALERQVPCHELSGSHCSAAERGGDVIIRSRVYRRDYIEQVEYKKLELQQRYRALSPAPVSNFRAGLSCRFHQIGSPACPAR